MVCLYKVLISRVTLTKGPKPMALSPIDRLVEPISQSPFLIAPEKRDALKAVTDKVGAKIKLDNSVRGFKVTVGLDSALIRFPLSALEMIWISSHVCLVLHETLRQEMARNPKTPVRLNPARDPRTRKAISLLTWIHENVNAENPAPWPVDTPTPTLDKVADGGYNPDSSLAISCAGFLLLHEIAHLELKHEPYNTIPEGLRKQQEVDADQWAANWILGEAAPGGQFFTRSLGIVVVLSLLTSLETYTDKHGGTTHPSSPERLHRFLSEFIPEHEKAKDEHEEMCNMLWAIAIEIIGLHMWNTEYEFNPETIYDSYSDCLGDYLTRILRDDRELS